MADLTEAQAALQVKIVGSDSTGLETNEVGASTNGLLVDVAASALPAGAATSALQTTQNTTLTTIDTDIKASQPRKMQDGAGTNLTSTLIGGKQRLDVDTAFSGADNSTAPTYTAQIGGIDPTGKIQAAKAAATGELYVVDAIDVSSQYAAQSVTTTAAEAKGGASRLVHRKVICITPTNGTVYWGTSSAVTIATGTPIFKNQIVAMAFTDNVPIYLIAAATVDCRIVEGS